MRRVVDVPCPHCGTTLSAVSGLKNPDDVPTEGCFSVCSMCGGLLCFTADLGVRKAEPDELDEFQKACPDAHAQMLECQRMFRKANERVKVQTTILDFRNAVGICQDCGKTDDRRPYGPGGKLVCYECAMKTPEIVKQEFDKLIGNPDVILISVVPDDVKPR